MTRLQCKICETTDIVESTCNCVLCPTCFQLHVIQNGISCRYCHVSLGKVHINGRPILEPINNPHGHIYVPEGAGVGDSSLHFDIPSDDRSESFVYFLKDNEKHRLTIEESTELGTYLIGTGTTGNAILKFSEDFQTATYKTSEFTLSYRLNIANQLINAYCQNMRANRKCPMQNCQNDQSQGVKYIEPECGHFACTKCMKSKCENSCCKLQLVTI